MSVQQKPDIGKLSKSKTEPEQKVKQFILGFCVEMIVSNFMKKC